MSRRARPLSGRGSTISRATCFAACLGVALVTTSAAAEERWPLWPNEVAVTAAPLFRDQANSRRAPEATRLEALAELERYPLELVQDALVSALEDSSPQVQRAALQQCLVREIRACIPGAQRIWKTSAGEASVRMLALETMLLDPSAEHVGSLLIALQDPREQLRNAATSLAGRVVLPPDSLDRIRDALIAKLADATPHVRASAARSLGRMGPGRGALAVTRLLQDPDPNVRRWAATALGQLRDERSIPALSRAVEAGDEPYVSRQMLHALGLLPDRDGRHGVDAMLLRLLDEQPRGLAGANVIDAIGLRMDPSPALVEGLVDRLAEPNLREGVLTALGMLGARARGPLEDALHRGLAPELELEVQRLLAALDLPEHAPEHRFAEPAPAPDSLAGWSDALEDPDIARRLHAGQALATSAPDWLGPTLVTRLAAVPTPEPVRAWLIALALAPASTARSFELHGGRLAWARVASWARARHLADDDRCLATLALAGAARLDRRGRRSRRAALTSLHDLARDGSADVRSCAALALGQFVPSTRRGARAIETDLAGLLHDVSARARVGALLGFLTIRDAGRPLTGPVRSHIALLARDDPHVAVRKAALAVLAPPGPTPDDAPGWLLWDLRTDGRVTHGGWVPATLPTGSAGQEPAELLLPARDFGGVAWFLQPGFHAHAAELEDAEITGDLTRLLIRFITN